MFIGNVCLNENILVLRLSFLKYMFLCFGENDTNVPSKILFYSVNLKRPQQLLFSYFAMFHLESFS